MLSIGKLARATGVKVPTIRYYETIGLLEPDGRSDGNQRLYAPRAVDQLAFIRHARELGFTLDAIRDLLQLADRPDQPCAAADAIARERLADVERRLAQLEALRGELQRMLTECAGGSVAQCRVLEVLGDHRHCGSDHGGRIELTTSARTHPRTDA